MLVDVANEPGMRTAHSKRFLYPIELLCGEDQIDPVVTFKQLRTPRSDFPSTGQRKANASKQAEMAPVSLSEQTEAPSHLAVTDYQACYFAHHLTRLGAVGEIDQISSTLARTAQ